MTKAEKLIEAGPLSITLKRDGSAEDDYIAEFKPDLANPLQITDKDFDGNDPYTGNIIYLSYESAVELAKFLKTLFLEEDTGH